MTSASALAAFTASAVSSRLARSRATKNERGEGARKANGRRPDFPRGAGHQQLH